MHEDLLNACLQFDRRVEMGLYRLAFHRKLLLIVLFFVVLPTVLFTRPRRDGERTVQLHYGETEAWRAIYDGVGVPEYDYGLIRKLLPVLPRVFATDIWTALRHDWKFVARYLPFFGLLALRVGQHYRFARKHRVRTLIVMQEYSPYMRYLTRIMEYEERSLVNIMHGIPGGEAAYFRFTRCFVWSEYYKNFYIANHADPGQFVVIGSFYHQKIGKAGCRVDEDIDLLYMMQGETHVPLKEREAVFALIQSIAPRYRVVCRQHPVYKIRELPPDLFISTDSPMELICRSRIVLSHHSTALLDALVLKKAVIAYTGSDKTSVVAFLPKTFAVTGVDALKERLDGLLCGTLVQQRPEHIFAIDDLDSRQIVRTHLKELGVHVETH